MYIFLNVLRLTWMEIKKLFQTFKEQKQTCPEPDQNN